MKQLNFKKISGVKAIVGIALLSVSSSIAAPKIWDGTADTSWYAQLGPNAQEYSLSTAEELAGLALLVNKGNSFAGKTIQLESDIFLNDTTGAAGGTWASVARTPWVPIGTSLSPFKGEFDGVAGKKNRKIYGLYFNDSTKSNVGLFGYTNNVMIKDIDLLVGKITAANNTGALIGYAVSGSVTNVHSEVKVTGKNKVGGLVGYSTGTLNRVSVQENVTGRDSVGGLVGYTSGSVSGTAKNNSFFVGDVSGRKYVGGGAGYGMLFSHVYTEGSVKGDSSYIGGLVGYAIGSIDSCHHAGGNIEGYSNVGGLVGYSAKKISFSYHVGGDVYGKNYYVGGLAGSSDTVKNSYVEGIVSGKSYIGGLVGYGNGVIDTSYHINGDVSGNDNVGGLAGYISKRVTSSYHYDGNVIGEKAYVGGLVGRGKAVVKCYAKGMVKSDSNYVGGLIGYTNEAITSSYHIDGDVSGLSYVGGLAGYAGTVSFSYHNEGNVKGYAYIGGLVGYGTTIKKAHAEGTVKSTSNYVGGLAGSSGAIDSSYYIGNVSGYSYVGGLVGKGRGTIKNSYSRNSVEGTRGYVGGLAGNNDSSIVNSFFKGNVSGAGDYVGGIVGYGVNVDQSYVEGSVKSTSNYVGGLIGYAKGTLTSSYHVGDEVTGLSYVGGLAGRLAYYVRDSYSESSIEGLGDDVGGLVGLVENSNDSKNLHFIGDVKGKNYVGGLIGKSSSNSVNVDVIANSYSIGNVVGVDYVGGIVGLDSVYLSSSYSTTENRKIRNSYSRGTIEGKKYVGGVVGKMRYANFLSALDSCKHFDGDIVGSSYVGGLAGSASNITNSYSEGNVIGDDDYVGGIAGDSRSINSSFHKNGYVKGNSYVGGLTGSVSDIINSYSDGDVNGSASYVGGLAGWASNIMDSHSKGNVSGEGDNIGGLVGYVNKIRGSHAFGSVKGLNVVGGLAGYAADSVDVSYSVADSVIGIYQVGGLIGYAAKMVDSSYATGNVKGDDNVGGLIGSAYGDVSNSYALGNVLLIDNYSSAGSGNRGGLVGYQWQGSISKSMAVGNVFGNTKIGGLVGRFDGISISESYANGNVIGSYYGDPANEIGNIYIGGLVGMATKGSLADSYVSGNVKGDNEPAYIGCIVGGVNGAFSIANSYYDEIKCNLAVEGVGLDGEPYASLIGTSGKTTAEMQTQSTFENWDFVDTWKIIDDSYPFLQIYANSLTNVTIETATLDGYKYDGTAKTPLVLSVKLFGETLEYETEYTIAYENNVNAGTAHINVCGVKPYGGCKVVDFEIAAIPVEPTIAAIENMTYTGRALIPEINVYNGETLLATTDYTVEYKDNVNAGMATASVTMKGNYSGSASQTFKIEKTTPVISQNPKAGDVVLGQTLASSELIGGKANVEGMFEWKTPSFKPTLENEGYAVVFVPADTANYTNSEEIVVPIKVLDMAYVAVHAGIITIDSMLIFKGSSYALPNAPDSVGYDFVGFYQGETLIGNVGDEITISENTVIDAVYKIKTFIVTFMNGSTVLQSGEVAYGVVPIAPKVTLPENTAQYTYSFEGWDKEIVAVTEAVTYNAVIDSVVNKYQVVFKDYDGTVLKDSLYAYGTLGSEIVMPTDTIRASTAQYTYTFTGWGPSIASVTGDAVYTAQYDSIVNVYEVAFVVPNDTLQSVKMNLAYGAVPAYEGTPTKEATAQYSYTFKGWSPEIESVSGVATYTAVFDSSVRAYTITFVNGSTPLQSDDVAYGTLPEYSGATPIKEATAQYTYTFKSWNPTIVDVTAAATYAAVFDSVVNKYMITFKLGADILQRDSVAYGTLPIAPTVTLPENTAKYTYSVAWNKEVVSVTGSATYTAIIDSILNKYEVVFKDYDGSVLKDSLYAYGTAVKKIVKPANPKRETTAMCTYTFKGWTPEISSVTEDVVYTAEYDSTIRSYTVAFVNGSTKLQSGKLLYGSTPEYNGNMPTKKSNAQYTYTFKGWNPEISSVTGAVTYTAIFDSTLKEYVVTFLNGKTKLQTGNVAYGSMPVYLGDVPTKAPTDSTTYKFVGWEPELATVSGKASYVAKFETVKKTFMVRFMNKFTLDMQVVSYGETPVYTGAVPTKEADEFYSYSFIGWSPEIGPVTRETDYVALFDSTDLSGIADFRLANLEMSVNVVSRNIQISAAPIGSAYAVLDMQGRVLRKGRVESANFNVSMPESGHYLVRVGEKTKRVSIK